MAAIPAAAFPGHTGDDDIHREIKKGVENYEKGRYEHAIESFNNVIKMTEVPSSKDVWNIRGTAFHYLNDYYEAIRCFDEASLDRPDYLEPLLNKALSLRRLGKYYESMQALNKYLSREPKAYRVINVKRVVYDDLKNYTEAIKCFDDIIDATKNAATAEDKRLRIKAINNRAMSLSNDGRYNEALREINKLKDLPKEAFILDTKAVILFQEGHYNEAKKILEEARQESHYDKYVWYHLGNVYSKLEKTHQALRCYREAIKIDDGFAEAYNDLAAELSKSERYDEARNALQEALKKKPELVAAHENLIRISLRHHITPTFWDFWTGSKYRKIAGAAIFVLAVFLIAFPLLSSLLAPIASDLITNNKQITNVTADINESNLQSFISLPLVGSAILTIILLAPTIKTAKVGSLEFSFLDSQRSVQPLSNVS